MQKIVSIPVKPLLWSILGAGLATLFALPIVFAQTFNDPECDPKIDPALCNKETPIFSALNPISTNQIIKTPLQVGEASTPQNLTLRGGLVLGQANAGITRAALAGTAIDVESSDVNAIIAKSSGTAALAANGLAAAGGLTASSINGNALYSYSVSGNAAFFEGKVLIGSTTKPSNVLLQRGNLTLANGNLAVTGALTVNGQPVSTGDNKTVTLTASILGNASRTFSATEIIGSPASGSVGSYRPLWYQAVYAVTGTRTWLPLVPNPAAAPTNLLFTECTGANFTGSLFVRNPSATPVMMKVTFAYKLEATDCSNADVTPPTVTMTAPTNGQNVSGVNFAVTGTHADSGGSGFKQVELFIDGAPTSPAVTYTGASPFSLSWDTTKYSDGQHAVSVRASDNAGNMTTTPAVNVQIVNGAGVACGSLICSGGTPVCCDFLVCNGTTMCISSSDSCAAHTPICS
ncbi:MAG: Ig-like domain-containing protein [Patescibacteria group bacterium]|jgi:hypothetical protein